MITSALHRAADWAKSVFSSAALGDPRRTTRLVNVAAQLAQQCQGRCGEVQAIATAATGLACFIFRFLRRPLSAQKGAVLNRNTAPFGVFWEASGWAGGKFSHAKTSIEHKSDYAQFVWGALWHTFTR